ncbi:hypothetical protein [Marixanthomonas spongiae]|uniref:Uncharacterized protein n=1 Tax=Marixanthomonas spongiae TaxID=2174845 RepID=A0A2U0HZT3_9FLAO|nr:hypothetical protein [Marixanthomonas spongiae]PVW14339.1 hypothetical protein DDV96_11110 [Marixanthomonas spongiae]
MEWINAFITILAVTIGWGLNEASKIWNGKRQDKRKLKKLLFYLLELRFYLSKEDNKEFKIKKLTSRFIEKFKLEFNLKEDDIDLDNVKNFLSSISLNDNENNNHFELLEKNIDIVIEDLSEIFPIMAYELNGQHKIKERLRNTDSNIEKVNTYLGDFPLNLKEWLKPKISNQLIDDIDESILKIAKRINSKTRSDAKMKLAILNNEDEENLEDIDKFIEDYIEKVKHLM